ncbi:hypothetical protein MLD52_06415 [Puniceicoccaceae bacterium K14]|nr:hypothetical protein [Puniceicoccaceae bacterium K14]
MTKSLKVALLGLGLTSLNAADYNWELTGLYEYMDSDFGDTKVAAGSIRYYVDSLDFGSSSLPKMEASIFERLSFFELAYAEPLDLDELDVSAWGASYVHRNAASNHIFSASYFRQEADDNSFEQSADVFEIGYGHYISDNWIVGVGVSRTKLEEEYISYLGEDSFSEELDAFTLNSSYISSLGNDTWLSVHAELGKVESGPYTFALNAAYHISEDIGFLAGYEKIENTDFFTLTVGYSQYINESIALIVEVDTDFIDGEYYEDEVHTYRGGATFRF